MNQVFTRYFLFLFCLWSPFIEYTGQQQVVIENPSFDYTPPLPGNANAPGSVGAPWISASVYFNCPGVCSIQPSPDSYPDGLMGMASSDGTEHVGMAAFNVNGNYTGGEALYQQLTCPIEAGVTYSFNIDVQMGVDWFSGGADPPADLVVCATNTPPANAEFDSPEILDQVTITQAGVWNTVTITFTPTQTYNYILLGGGWSQGGGFGGSSYFYIDNITNTATSCGIQLDLDLTSDTICLNDCTNLEATVTNGTPPFTFTWSDGSLNGSGPFQVCPDSTTTYTAIVVDATGESDTATIDLTVVEYPNVTLVSSADTICSGSGVQLTANGALDYIWNPGSSSSNTLSATPQTTTTYTVTGANWQCYDTASVTVVVLPAPTYSLNSENPSCYGFSDGWVSLSNVSTTNYAATWNNTITDSLINLPEGTYVLELIDLDAGCTLYDSISLTQPDSISIQISGTFEACLGDSTLLSGSATGGTAPYTYQWLNGPTTSDYYVTPDSNTTYTLEVIDDNGCINSELIEVIINLPPTIDLGPTYPYQGCEILTVQFENYTSGNNTYLWDLGDGTTSTDATPINDYPIAGLYDVSLTATSPEGCISIQQFPNYVEVFEVPEIDLSVSSTELDEINDPTLTIYGSSMFSDSCIIDFGDGNVIETCDWNGMIYNYSNPGVYTITITSYNDEGCSSTETIEINFKQTPSLYVPNAFSPNNDGVNDEFLAVGVNIETFEMIVFDRWGEAIFTSEDINTGWDGIYQGVPVKQDAYVYKIIYKTINNDHLEKTGHVVLLR